MWLGDKLGRTSVGSSTLFCRTMITQFSRTGMTHAIVRL